MQDGPAAPLFAIMDMMPGPAFVVDETPDGHFVLAHLNRYYTGHAHRASRLVGRRIDAIFPLRTARALELSYRACLEAGASPPFDELLDIFGDERWWRTTLGTATPPPGMRHRIIGVSTDITDLKARADLMAVEIAHLRECHAEIHTLAALTAHDMRGPLANVVSLTELILDGFRDLGDGKAEMIRACGGIAEHSLGAISQIMGRVAKPLPQVDARGRVDLALACRQICAIVDPSGAIDIAHPETVIETDDVVVTLALRNLLDNASRFAESRIDITLVAVSETEIAITVADDGAGFLPGIDPVARASARTGVEGGARGYGLGAVIRLLRSRGGALAAVPTPLGGAAMRFSLPGRIVATDRAGMAVAPDRRRA